MREQKIEAEQLALGIQQIDSLGFLDSECWGDVRNAYIWELYHKEGTHEFGDS